MQRILILTLLAVIALSACSTHKDTFYKHQPTGLPLEVPPDLTMVETSNTFVIPEISQVTRKQQVLVNGAELTLKKDGLLRWIEVQAAPELLWEEVNNFWLSNDVELAWENTELGIIETAWLKNYDSKYDLDRFRVRIEANSDDRAEIYLTHRGKQQEVVDGSFVEGWADEFNDPELEIEVLGELLSYLGLSRERKEQLVQEAKKARAIASLSLKTGEPHILINDEMERAWKLVTQAVDRAGHVITQRDKAANWLEVRLVKAGQTADFVPGFALSDNEREVLRVQLQSQEGGIKVFVLNDSGQLDQTQQARDFLRELNGYL